MCLMTLEKTISWMFYLTTGRLVHLCENARITAEIGRGNGYLKLFLYNKWSLSMLSFFKYSTALDGKDTQPKHLSEKIEFSWKRPFVLLHSYTSCFKLDELWGNIKYSVFRCNTLVDRNSDGTQSWCNFCKI